MNKTLQGNVADVKVKRDGRLYVKVERDGSLVGNQIVEDDEQELIKPKFVTSKVIKSSHLASASIKATENYATGGVIAIGENGG